MDVILEFLKPNKERENTLRGKEYLRLFLSKKNPRTRTFAETKEETFKEEKVKFSDGKETKDTLPLHFLLGKIWS